MNYIVDVISSPNVHTMIRQQIYDLACSLFVKEDQPAIRKSLRTCLPRLSRVVLDESGRQPLAFTIVTESTPGVAFISFCGVSPTLQGRGIGSRLLEETLAGIFSAGGKYLSCQLLVDDWNAGAMRLYVRHGFVPVGIVQEPHSRCILMQRSCLGLGFGSGSSPSPSHNISSPLDSIEDCISCLPASFSSNPIMCTYLTT